MTRLSELALECLVIRARGGDLIAFGELARWFRGALTLIAEPILGSRADAEDAAQDTLLLAYKALPQLADPSRFPGWICAIVRHRAKRIGIKGSRVTPEEPSKLDRLILEQAADPATVFAQRSEWDCLRAYKNALPPEYRTVIHLRYWEEWPVSQIAAFLTLPMTTVKWRLHYGRDLLRRALLKEMETETDGTE